MKIKDILEVINGKLISGNENDELGNFSKDSRTVAKGDVYVAIKGENFDGNKFAEHAIKNGAKTCILSKLSNEIKEYDHINIIEVADTLLALQQIATYKRSMYNIPVVAVTGSVGKTSTKDIIASVMSTKYKVLKTQGNMNNEIGLPMTILNLKDEEALVVEMGMNHFGEIRLLTKIAKPTLAVITNIGTAHIGNLGSRENILKAKLEILEGLQGDTVVINNDNDLLNKWAKENASINANLSQNYIFQNQELNKGKYNIITYGIENESNYMAENIESYEDKSVFNIGKYRIIVPVGGQHFVLNALCAVAVGKYFDIPMNKIIKGIADLELTQKRMQIENTKVGAIIINDTYNANYDSMKAAIKYLEGVENRRKIAVLGDMLELGEYSQKLHEDVGSEIKNIDILITVGEQSKNIARNAKAKEILSFENNQQAIEKIKEIISKEDAILLKASNSMKFNEIVEELKKF